MLALPLKKIKIISTSESMGDQGSVVILTLKDRQLWRLELLNSIIFQKAYLVRLLFTHYPVLINCTFILQGHILGYWLTNIQALLSDIQASCWYAHLCSSALRLVLLTHMLTANATLGVIKTNSTVASHLITSAAGDASR